MTHIENRQRTFKVNIEVLSDLVTSISIRIWDRPVEVSITLLGRRQMAFFNRRYRRIMGPTDQISFPAPAGMQQEHFSVGDVLICPAVISEQCQTPSPDGRPDTGNINDELLLVLIHGLLHLAGMKHRLAGDKTRMIAREHELYALFHGKECSGILEPS